MRLTRSFSGVIVVMAAGVAQAAVPLSGLEKQGEALVEARCVACHSTKSLPRFVDRCTERRGVDYLDRFLTRHHAPDEEARAAIIAYLTCQRDEPAQ